MGSNLDHICWLYIHIEYWQSDARSPTLSSAADPGARLPAAV